MYNKWSCYLKYIILLLKECILCLLVIIYLAPPFLKSMLERLSESIN